MISVSVNRKGADRIRSGHPWVFASDVLDAKNTAPASTVSVLDPKGRHLGTAHFSSSSQITLRMLSRHEISADKTFFRERLLQAREFRRRVVSNSNAFRLVFGEADLLPGLVTDVYDDVVVLQTLTQAMDAAKEELADVLDEMLAPRAILVRNDVSVRARESLPLEKGVLRGEDPGPIQLEMNGLRFSANVLAGQKTGIYLDQRENYLAAGRHGFGNALDCFTSSGGFALHLAKSCDWVEAIDSSATALDTARENAASNELRNIHWRKADVFDALTEYAASTRKFDTVILDPPAFTKSRGAVEGAARGYKDINQRALRLLSRGGILISCSCSHHFSEAMLLETIAAAALDANKTLRVLERRTQAADHPILLTVPETMYLKCLVFQVLP